MNPGGLSEMRNLGEVSARMLAETGISDANALRKCGAVAAYKRLKFRFGRQVTLIFLYAMEAAIQDIDWRQLTLKTRERLRSEATESDRDRDEYD